MSAAVVSILIPAHNAQAYVGAAIESALNQTWPHREVIVVDDSSSDDTAAVARRAGGGNVTLLSGRYGSAAAARNAAFAASRGDLIQYLDADDLLAPDKVALQVATLEQSGPEHVSSCSWGRFRERPGDMPVVQEPVWRNAGPVDWLVDAWTGGGMMQTACWLTPRRLIERAGLWNTHLRNDDDGEFFCRVLLRSRGVQFCPAAWVHYRSGISDSLSQRKGLESAEAMLRTCESYEREMLAVDRSVRARAAIASTYANLVYRFHPSFPDVMERAFSRMRALAAAPPRVGGRRFNLLARLVGLRKALALRAIVRGALA